MGTFGRLLRVYTCVLLEFPFVMMRVSNSIECMHAYPLAWKSLAHGTRKKYGRKKDNSVQAIRFKSMDAIEQTSNCLAFEFVFLFGPPDGKQLDDALVEQQQEAYKVHGVDEDEPVDPRKQKKKRKHDANGGEEVSLLLSPLPSSDHPSHCGLILAIRILESCLMEPACFFPVL